ncbi:MAG: hypothetical protein V1837_07455 [Candidatus Woesearchaeota archaeon]
MREVLGEANEELKRADHLIYVSLKYTRSVDVIKSVFERLINAYSIVFRGLLVKAKEKKLLAQIPTSPGSQCDLVREIYRDDLELLDYIKFYLLLRKMDQGKFTRAHEFRRNVTMTVTVDNKQMEVNIDIVTEYYKRSLKFLEYAKERFLR